MDVVVRYAEPAVLKLLSLAGQALLVHGLAILFLNFRLVDGVDVPRIHGDVPASRCEDPELHVPV